MKILVVGGVAAGTKTAAKLKRANRSADITLLTKERDISYASCNLPYFIGGLIEDPASLIVNTPKKFETVTGVSVRTETEVTAVHPEDKTVSVRTAAGTEEIVPYDRLVLAVGASAVVPPIKGFAAEGVFTLRTPADAVGIREAVSQSKHAVIIGGSFIGLELAENLHARGVAVHVVEAAPQLLPGVFDYEMADYVRRRLEKSGISVLTGTKAEEIIGDPHVTSVRTTAGLIACDTVLVSVGIRANTAFLEGSGIELSDGKIVTDDCFATSCPDIFAVGDCILVKNRITGKSMWSAMGSSANIEGRQLAKNLTAACPRPYGGALGTGIVKLPEISCGRTGLTEQQAKDAGYEIVSSMVIADDKPHAYPGASFFCIKLICTKEDHKLLGVQVIGAGSVDKIIDIAVTGIQMGAALEDFDHADYAYAPPFSTAVHPFVQAVYVMENKLAGDLISMTPAEYLAGKAAGFRVVEVGPTASIPGAAALDIKDVTDAIPGFDKDDKLLLVCNRGRRAYLLQNRLRYHGYVNSVVLEGGVMFNIVKVQNVASKLSNDDITRVKGLGCLRDKTTPDCFNVRVITRNGKITAEESQVITDAAKKFGNGQIAMTTRLTIEIQCVPYENIEPLRAYLAMAGLETGGTGSKVRPVVSCKGTTCQYGLIDTFALSEAIHTRFYQGYHNVKLPHKFKIAVGGCPNNCVKPNLNDLGIVGQRVIKVNYEACRGCKVCQISKTCPVKAASVVDGKIVIDPAICNNCGRCLNKCPFHVFDNAVGGYKVYVGGRWGKKVAQGRPLSRIFTSQEEVLDIVEKAILLFRDQGITGERFSDTIARLGMETVEAQLYSDELLKNKENNLQAQKHLKGGATC